MSTAGKSKFQSHCEKLVARLTSAHREAFAALLDDEARVRFIYPLAAEQPLELANWARKDMDRAESLKTSGNKLYQHRNLEPAICVYNEALMRCPQDDLQGQELHAILVANRSAVYFDQKHFTKVLKDIDYLIAYGHHPHPHKLHVRAAKTCEALQSYASAVKHYSVALQHLQHLQDSSMNTLVAEIDKKLQELSKHHKDKSTIPVEIIDEEIWRSQNITFPALSSKLAVKSNSTAGRYIIAQDDIKVGEIVAVERPYTAVLHADAYRTNCAHCARSTDQIRVCVRCCSAVFCTRECEDLAFAYHQHECGGVLHTLHDAGVSVNCLMAMRMITQRSLQQVHADEAYARTERNVVIYKTADYYNVARLVAHESDAPAELLHYAFMATHLLRLLKTTDYFATKTLTMSDEEAFVGALMLKYLRLLQYNAHEIAELRNAQADIKEATLLQQMDCYYTSSTVGAGLYPTLALFNHSCDPSVIRYNIDNTMVLRAIKPVKAGEDVFENYGPLYTSEARFVRRERMLRLYRFACACRACEEDWPTLDAMDANILRVRCDCGEVLPTDKDIPVPYVTCAACKKDKNLLPVLTGLIPLGMKSQRAEELFADGRYVDAEQAVVDVLTAYVKYLAAPFADMVLLQQRLKSCLLHRGNRRFDYRDLPSSKK